MSTFEIIASNGQEVDRDTPVPRWGFTDGADSFVDEIAYQDGDTITDAVARFQQADKLPTGEVSVGERERCDVDWVHEDHPYRYHVTIID
ncbi:hypothetical protein NE857_21890 [Nocardiopsis exhalans]|uniref:Peptidoglycan binding domain-containing protein n=1 Tax=Nocardiopsis exhalans TaxID=163604 RepID=A0ABY5D1U9_9ACTN|nr:hypothetical protein [Nocardiopsis exhalans]USY17970.1 hypothetical protein NE857_21890 [Nocardiopsis exhalans]